MAPITIKARGILFDLDGTLISEQFTCNTSWVFQYLTLHGRLDDDMRVCMA